MKLRRVVEAILSVIAGLGALALPVLIGDASRGHEAAVLPFMADVVEGVRGYSLLALFMVGVVGGLAGKASPALLGFASASSLPLWSFADIRLGGQGHNLLPLEWAIYGFYGFVGTAGAIVGRNRGLRAQPK
jgi:hypothetical protein